MKKKEVSGYIEEVIDLLQRERGKVALNIVNFGIKNHPHSDLLLILKATVLNKIGYPNKADSLLTKISKHDLKPTAYKLLLITQVEVLFMKKEFLKVNTLLDKLLQEYPQEHTVLEYKGKVLMRLKKYKKALSYLIRAHQIEGRCNSCLEYLAECYYFTKDNNQATKLYKILLQRNPKDIDLLRRLFLMYYKLKDYNTAFKLINRIIKIKKESLAYAYKAEILLKFNEKEKAAICYKLAINIALKSEKHNNNCGCIVDILKDYTALLVKIGRKKEACLESKRIFKRCPKNKKIKKFIIKNKFLGI